MNNVEKLFSKPLRVRLKTYDGIDKCLPIQIEVENNQITTPIHKKEIVIRLTDDSNLFFLYNLTLGEEDFQVLKSQQGLLIDFMAFPKKFIGLLGMCREEEMKEVPKFILELHTTSSTATLCVTETNEFKHLTHLSLKFLPATEPQLNKHLANLVHNLREIYASDKDRLETTVARLEKELNSANKNLQSKSRELEDLRAEWSMKSADLTAKKAEEISLEREKAMQTQVSVQQRFEREKKELEQAHMNIVKEFEIKIRNLQSGIQEQREKRYEAENSNKELIIKFNALELTEKQLEKELSQLRLNHSSLSSVNSETERNIRDLQGRISSLEEELKDKTVNINKLSDIVETKQTQLKKFEDDVESKNQKNTKLESSVKTLSGEMIKANEIIKKLQNEVKSYHSKLKLRTQVSSEQEKLLSEKGRQLDEVRKDEENLKVRLEKKEMDIKKMKDSIDNLEEKLSKSTEQNKTNENVIQWLNKQITDMQLGKSVISTSGTLDYSSSTKNSIGYRQTPVLQKPPVTVSFVPISTAPPPLTASSYLQNTYPLQSKSDNFHNTVSSHQRSSVPRPPTSNGIDSKYLQKTNEAETKIASSRAPLASAYFPSK